MLIVDDVDDNLLALEGVLKRGDIEIVTAPSGPAALEALLRYDVAVAIIDVMMPDMDGFELAELIRGVERTRHIPIIFVTAASKAEYRAFAGYQLGAIDFLFKPLDEYVLRAKVDVLIKLEKQRRELELARGEAEQARAETEVLLELAQITSHSEKPAEVYEPALVAVRELLGAERSAILLFDESSRMRFHAWRGLSDAYRAAVDGHSPWHREEGGARPILIPDVAKDEGLAAYRSTFASERIGAIGFVPLVAGGLIGKFTLYWEQPRTFTAHDEALAVAIASQLAEALARARLRDAERRGHERLIQLQRITASLNEVVTPDTIGSRCLPVMCETIGAVSGALYMLSADGADLELIGSYGASEEAVRSFRRVSVDSKTGVSEAVRTRAPVIVESREEYAKEYGDHLVSATSRYGTRVVIPLVVEGRVVGTVGFGLSSWRVVPPDDRTFLLTTAGQCAQALERARLHEAERSARARAEAAEARKAFLAEATTELAASLENEVTLRKIAELAVPRLADWCVVELATGPVGESARVALVHVDPAKIRLAEELRRRYPPDPKAPHGVPNVLRTGRSELYADIRDEQLVSSARDAQHLGMMRDLGITSAMVVPIAMAGRTLGVISFVAAESGRHYDEHDLKMAEELGWRAGVAIQNARLFEALRDSETRYRTLFEVSVYGVITIDEAGAIETANPAAERIFGYSVDELVGRNITMLMPEPFGSEHGSYLQDHQRTGERKVIGLGREVAGRRRDGSEFPIDLAVSEFRVGGRRYFKGLVCDITERKQLEQAREAALASLRQTLHDNEIFAGVLAHDLRNPLGAIVTASQLVLRRSEGNECVTKPVARILSSGNRMTRMIDQMLDFTRARIGGGIDVQTRETDLALLCEQAIGELEVANPTWRLTMESLGVLRGSWDPDRLLQVVSNLLANAGQHGRPDGAIRIKLDGTGTDSVVLEVHNAGSIPEALLPTLFAPFRGARERRSQGLGLGLFITKEIVVGHGGSIDVTSSEATGTTFSIRLPRHASSRPSGVTDRGP